MTRIFLAAGEPTWPVALGQKINTDYGLTKQGRRQIRSAGLRIIDPAWVITSLEPDARESARLLLGDRFAHDTHYMPELAIDRNEEASLSLWQILQTDRFRECTGPIVILVRSGMIYWLVRDLYKRSPMFEKIRHLLERTSFDFGDALRISSTGRGLELELC